jgi:hypothetical protein
MKTGEAMASPIFSMHPKEWLSSEQPTLTGTPDDQRHGRSDMPPSSKDGSILFTQFSFFFPP